MDLTTLLGQLTTLTLIISSIAATVISIITATKQTKKDDIDIRKSEKTEGVEITERLSGVSLSLVESLKEQLRICDERRTFLQTEFEKNSVERTELKVKLKLLVFKLRDILHTHDEMYNAREFDCEAFQVINSMIDKLITEIENGVDLDDKDDLPGGD